MYIPYAKKAKQINVKKLKAKIWSTLTNDTDVSVINIIFLNLFEH